MKTERALSVHSTYAAAFGRAMCRDKTGWIACALIALSGCATDPIVVVRNPDPATIYVAPTCWEPCPQSPGWVKRPDGTGDWDALGESQNEIEQQKAHCEASRKACADALQRLESSGVIVTGERK